MTNGRVDNSPTLHIQLRHIRKHFQTNATVLFSFPIFLCFFINPLVIACIIHKLLVQKISLWYSDNGHFSIEVCNGEWPHCLECPLTRQKHNRGSTIWSHCLQRTYCIDHGPLKHTSYVLTFYNLCLSDTSDFFAKSIICVPKWHESICFSDYFGFSPR